MVLGTVVLTAFKFGVGPSGPWRLTPRLWLRANWTGVWLRVGRTVYALRAHRG